ncbi:MAG: exosortase-dependent surface protein XDP1 [Cellvibrionaceae bacterium]
MATPVRATLEMLVMSNTHIRVGFKKGLLAAASLALFASLGVNAAVDATWGLKRSDVGYSYSVYASTATGGTYNYVGNDGDSDNSNNITANISGWAETSGIRNYNSNLVHWSGGIGLDRSNDGHAVDNSGSDEFLVFRFSEPVSISTYSFGWVGNDGDSTLLAYDPNNDGFHDGYESNASLGLQSSQDIGDLISNGWDAIGHYAGNSNNQQTINPSTDTQDIFSSYWIIGAYLSDITPLLSGGLHTKDAFKLSSIGVMRHTPDTPDGEAPIPSSAYLILLGLALLRRQRK